MVRATFACSQERRLEASRHADYSHHADFSRRADYSHPADISRHADYSNDRGESTRRRATSQSDEMHIEDSWDEIHIRQPAYESTSARSEAHRSEAHLSGFRRGELNSVANLTGSGASAALLRRVRMSEALASTLQSSTPRTALGRTPEARV